MVSDLTLLMWESKVMRDRMNESDTKARSEVTRWKGLTSMGF